MVAAAWGPAVSFRQGRALGCRPGQSWDAADCLGSFGLGSGGGHSGDGAAGALCRGSVDVAAPVPGGDGLPHPQRLTTRRRRQQQQQQQHPWRGGQRGHGWAGGRPDRRTEAPRSPYSQPQPRGPARPPAPSPRPGGFREPRPGGGRRARRGRAASGVGAGAGTSEVASCSPRLRPPSPAPPARSRNGVSAGMGPNTPAPVWRGADGRSPRLGLPTCPADSRSPLRELPENQVRWRGDSAQCRCPHAVSAPRMSVPAWKSNPGIPPLRTQHRPAHWDDDPVAVVIQPPRLSRLSLGPGQAWLECPGQRDRNWQPPGTPEAISRLRGAPADSHPCLSQACARRAAWGVAGLPGPAAHGGSQLGPCLTLGFSNKTSQTYEFIHIYISHTTDCKLQDQGAGRRRV